MSYRIPDVPPLYACNYVSEKEWNVRKYVAVSKRLEARRFAHLLWLFADAFIAIALTSWAICQHGNLATNLDNSVVFSAVCVDILALFALPSLYVVGRHNDREAKARFEAEFDLFRMQEERESFQPREEPRD